MWIASDRAGTAYAVTLYYIPLFFAFMRGCDTNNQTIRLLLFIIVFIVVVLLTGILLLVIGRYKLIYLYASSYILAGTVTITALINENVSEVKVLAAL